MRGRLDVERRRSRASTSSTSRITPQLRASRSSGREHAVTATGPADRLPLHAVHGSERAPRRTVERADQDADVVLGDRYGTSCRPRSSSSIARGSGDASGLRLRSAPEQAPTRAASSPNITVTPQSTHRHALQIEVNRSIYMDERTHRAKGRVRSAVKAPITGSRSSAMAEAGDSLMGRRKAAAE